MRFELILCKEIFRRDGVGSKQVLVELSGLPVKDEGLQAEVTVSFLYLSAIAFVTNFFLFLDI